MTDFVNAGSWALGVCAPFAARDDNPADVRPTSDILRLQVDQAKKEWHRAAEGTLARNRRWLIANYLSDEFRIKGEPNSFLKAIKGYVSAICHFQ
jgi:hypothetical protein